MVAIGRAAGVATTAVMSDMDQPEGAAIGNALEVVESIESLRGKGPADVRDLACELARALGAPDAERTLSDGSALAKFREMVVAQGGDGRAIDDPSRLARASLQRDLPSPESGFIQGIDAERLGRASVALGAGRSRKDEVIDPAVGFILKAKVGDRIESGQPLLEVHANSEDKLRTALASAASAYTFSRVETPRQPQVHAVFE
jgi:pyrimidine-nucleoside phosphorylase